MLAHAIRAQTENDESLTEMRAGLGENADDSQCWATRRALLISPIEDAAFRRRLVPSSPANPSRGECTRGLDTRVRFGERIDA